MQQARYKLEIIVDDSRETIQIHKSTLPNEFTVLEVSVGRSIEDVLDEIAVQLDMMDMPRRRRVA